MSMFAKGEFNIKESWGGQQKQTPVQTPSSQLPVPLPPNQGIDQKISPSLEKQTSLSSILNQAGKQSVQHRDLLDDEISRRIVANLRNEGGIAENLPGYARRESPKGGRNPVLIGHDPNQRKPPVSNSGKSDSTDILTTLAARLSQVQQLSNHQREQIKQKTLQIALLQEELDMYQKNPTEEKQIQEMKTIQKDNQALKKRIVELENFLSYYGMKWVGDNPATRKAEGKLDIDRLQTDLDPSQQPQYNFNLPKEIDLNIVLRRIEQLNYIMEKDGVQEVYKEGGVHKLRQMESFPIGFYSNGIAMKGFPFFVYGSHDAMQILSDILDGYFPFQLKQKFPDGTLLTPIDRTETPFEPDQIGEYNDIHNIDELALQPISQEEFLDQLPKNVIKNGKVIPIRDEVRKQMDGMGKQPWNDDVKGKFPSRQEPDGSITPLTQEQKMIDKNQLSQEELGNITMLKIRTESGKQTIFLRLSSSKTMKEVYQICVHYSQTKSFELFSNATRSPILRDAIGTLQDLELHPSSVLNMKKL